MEGGWTWLGGSRLAMQSHLSKYFLVGAKEKGLYGRWTDLAMRFQANCAELQNYNIYLLSSYCKLNL